MGNSASSSVHVTKLMDQIPHRSTSDTLNYLAKYVKPTKLAGGLSKDALFVVVLGDNENERRLLKLFCSRKQMKRECRMLKSNQDISPKVYDCFVTEQTTYQDVSFRACIVMEYLGAPWTSLASMKPKTANKKLQKAVCKTIQQMHDNDTMHYNLHAGNIMVKENKEKFEIKIIDYGHALTIDNTHHKWRGTKLSDYELSCLDYNRYERKAKLVQKMDDSKETVMVLDLGTFCDFALMDTVRKELKATFNVVNVSNQKTSTCCHVHFRIDYQSIDNIVRKAAVYLAQLPAESGMSKFIRLMKHRHLSSQLMAAQYQIARIVDHIAATMNVSHVLLHSAHIATVLLADKLSNVPKTLLHYCPGYLPNNTYQYPFSDRFPHMTSIEKEKQTKQIWSTYGQLSRMGSAVNSMQHLLMYEDPLIPHETFASDSKFVTKRLGSIYPTLPKQDNLPQEVNTFIQTQKNKKRTLILLTFGSFLKPFEENDFLMKLGQKILEHNAAVLFMGKTNQLPQSNQILSYEKFLSYEKVVPKCDIIIFTGSICLQNVAWQFQKPMGMVPHLNEQYFWAEMYEKLTGIGYINKRKAGDFQNLHSILEQTSPLENKVRIYNPSDTANNISKALGNWKKTYSSTLQKTMNKKNRFSRRFVKYILTLLYAS